MSASQLLDWDRSTVLVMSVNFENLSKVKVNLSFGMKQFSWETREAQINYPIGIPHKMKTYSTFTQSKTEIKRHIILKLRENHSTYHRAINLLSCRLFLQTRQHIKVTERGIRSQQRSFVQHAFLKFVKVGHDAPKTIFPIPSEFHVILIRRRDISSLHSTSREQYESDTYSPVGVIWYQSGFLSYLSYVSCTQISRYLTEETGSQLKKSSISKQEYSHWVSPWFYC